MRPVSLVFVSATSALVLAAPRPAAACQYPDCHSNGAVAKPVDFEISLPFKAGEKVLILSGYGPDAGSTLHCRAQDGQCANDYYALDLALTDYPNNGKGQPVLAAASGTVLAAGWGTSGWAAYGQRVYIQHDYKADGHKYVTMYAHLDSVTVQAGQKIAKGAQIGTLGQSCNEALSCGNFSSPHVHFALHRDSNFGGSGSGGSYAGRAVIPEPFDGNAGLKQNDVVVSKNGDVDPPPPMECPPIPPAGAVLEETSPCASSIGGGTLNESGGHDGHAYWTPLAVPSPDYDAGLLWNLNFEQAGAYTLSVFVPAAIDNRAPAATYKVAYDGGADKPILDQTQGGDIWLPLGTWTFTATPNLHWIRIGNNYDLPEHAGTNLSLDALKVEPAPACECNGVGATESKPCDMGGEETRTCDGCVWSPWSGCGGGGSSTTDMLTGADVGTGSDITGVVSGTGGDSATGGAPTTGDPGGTTSTTGAGGDTTGSGAATLPFPPGWGGSNGEGGCGCRSDMTDRTWPLGLLALLALRRRRRA